VRYLTCSLLVECDSDLAFLERLLSRQLEVLGSGPVGFYFDQIVLSKCRTVHSRERIQATVTESLDCYDLVFVHNDHKERGKLDQLRGLLHIPANSRLINLVPVYETEAWILADPIKFS
jgi:hypothetical protein